MSKVQLDAMLKAQQWEITKGHLRAMCVMQGSYSTGGQGREFYKFLELKRMTDEFIIDVETNGLHE